MVTQGFSVSLLSPEKEQRNVPFLCMTFSCDFRLHSFEHSCLIGFAGEQKGCFFKEIVKKCNFCCQRFRLQKTIQISEKFQVSFCGLVSRNKNH
jgi:hypothetical protein